MPWLGLSCASCGDARLPSRTVFDLLKLVGCSGGVAVHSSTTPKPVPAGSPLS